MRSKPYLMLLLSAAVCSGALADSDDVPADVGARLRATLKERIPELHIEAIHPGPVPGLYELNAGSELLYINEAGTLIFAGRMIDTKSRRDLTAERWNTLNAVSFDSLPLNLAIKTVRGDGSRKLAVFADPFCPYCKVLEREMQGVTNVTIYTFLYPIESLHPGASVKSVEIWCAKDRSSAWTKWMVDKVDPGDVQCKGTPVEELQKVGEKLHIDSTPTLFTVDGKRTRGAIKHNEIEQLLAEAHK
jgi:thiol:disulfide interchange protein DsbC